MIYLFIKDDPNVVQNNESKIKCEIIKNNVKKYMYLPIYFRLLLIATITATSKVIFVLHTIFDHEKKCYQ